MTLKDPPDWRCSAGQDVKRSSRRVAFPPLTTKKEMGSDTDPRTAGSCIISRPSCTFRLHMLQAARPWSSGAGCQICPPVTMWGPPPLLPLPGHHRSPHPCLSPGITKHLDFFPACPLGYFPGTVTQKKGAVSWLALWKAFPSQAPGGPHLLWLHTLLCT